MCDFLHLKWKADKMADKIRSCPTHLCVDFIDDPFKPLSTSARVEADVLCEDVFHVSIEWNAFYAHRRLLSQQRLGRVCGMRSVLKNFVHGEETAKRHVCCLEGHFTLVGIHHRTFAGVAYFRRSDDL